MSDHSCSGGEDGQRQCRRDVELDAAMVLADMAAAGPEAEAEAELASTRLSLELGKVGIRSAASPCSSSSSAGHSAQHQAILQPPAAAAVPGYGPRPRHVLTEAEKEAKRLRRVLANRESARQTILRRQAIRDELARKVADLASQNESMKKEKDVVMQEYLSLKEANKQLKQQVAIKTTKKKAPAPAVEPMDTAPPGAAQLMEAVTTTATPPSTPPHPAGFLYTSAPPAAVPVPYVWGSWPPCYEHGANHAASAAPPPPLCLPPCAWYYPVVATDPRGSPPASYLQPRAAAEPAGSPGGGAGTAEEDTDDDPCSLTLAIDVDKRIAPPSAAHGAATGAVASDREKAATAAEARKRRKELTKLKQMHGAGARPPGGGEHWP